MSRTPQPRPNVLAIPPYVAGKPPKPRPGVTSYKLSSNERHAKTTSSPGSQYACTSW